jgi:hypothetical protein
MPDRLQWTLNLDDRLSGPAARVERQLRQVRAELKALDIAAKEAKLDKIVDPMKRQRAELQLQRDKLLQAKDAFGKHTKAMHEGRDALRDWLIIGTLVGRALGWVASKAVQAAGAIRQAVGGRESAMLGLSTFLGGAAGGVYGQMTGLAAATGRSAGQTLGWAQSLAMAGVGAGQIRGLTTRAAGLENIAPGSGEAFARVIAGGYSAGRVTAGDIEGLRGTALNPERIFEEISARYTGVRNRITGQRIAAQPMGLRPEDFAALLSGEADRLGAVGKAYAGGATLEGRIRGVGTNVDRQFASLARSPGVAAVKDLLKNLEDIFDPGSKSGKRMHESLMALSTALGNALAPLTGTGGKRNMELFFEKLIDLAQKAVPIISALGWAFSKFVDASVIVSGSWDLVHGRQPEHPEALRSAMNSYFGPSPGAAKPPVTTTINVGNVTIHGFGATSGEAEADARRQAKAFVDALRDLAVQQGALPAGN